MLLTLFLNLLVGTGYLDDSDSGVFNCIFEASLLSPYVLAIIRRRSEPVVVLNSEALLLAHVGEVTGLLAQKLLT